ncbi:MAG: metallophosphoesterase [Proteobacteria bacterium]|nr:metallophosphoesterase [Pseudomonadota bacterium]MCH8951218.1 metallophosphoesterase [Pseudomonadota bacterium]
MRPFSSTIGATAGLALTLALSLAAMPTGAAADVRFIVFGDAPYGVKQSDLLDRDVAPAIKNDKPSFVIHLGDFLQTKTESCAKPLFGQRYEQAMGLHEDWVFYTPGDNDWTDCDDSRMKKRGLNPVSEVDQLKILRGLIKGKRMKPMLVKEWVYETQQELGFPENARWTQGNVMFATIHIVGTNNGRDWINIDDEEATLDLVDARDRANRTWLDAAFDAASNLGPNGAGAVVIAIQADVYFVDYPNVPCFVPDYTVSERKKRDRRSERIKCDGFAAFRAQLRKLAAKFEKPVLLIHGDTGKFCLDNKFGGGTAPNLRRLNAFGDVGEVDATVISVHLDREQPFEINRLRTGGSPKPTCP